ncbi:hypothetical protein MTE01_29100 [Microbacterium testaceum]|uniref:Uncharacterized protein n=1 Tax=Microbacterium testaceum TaxID=2033 RepID=A0A4Y3QNX0_MICTE|nr:hypothetical protein [Microbacterium testaceum]GEB46965.1 hypothetical protein MTE01_29100 [Microbacterium testaceum]
MTDPITPRKKRPLGPVHLFPEPPKTLAAGSLVADVANSKRHGKVKTTLPGGRLLVEWDGSVAPVAVHRTALLSLFSTSTPAPRTRKAAA